MCVFYFDLELTIFYELIHCAARFNGVIMPSFQFDYNESKVLNSMFDQTMKQYEKANMSIDKRALDVIQNIAHKVKAHKGKKINFSQQEHQFLKKSISESITQMNKQMAEVWFGKRFLMKMMMKSYKQISNKLNNIPKVAKKK